MFTNKNYITIQGFMITNLKLSGNELILYAIIYGFTQNGETKFNGTLDYVSSALNVTRANAKHILDRLVEKNFILKEEFVKDGKKRCRYYCNDDWYQNDTDTGIKTIPNNNIDNNINTKKYSIDEKRQILREKCEPYVAKYGRPMIEAFLNYWGAANDSQTLLACEIAKRKTGTFDIARRLVTWAQNNTKVQPTTPQPTKPKRGIWEDMGLTKEQYINLFGDKK